MKMIVLRCSILAAIIFIPLTSIQHFIEPLSDCLLADICNHTWIPECAEDANIGHRRLFIDDCDIYEYNCDYDVKYLIVNYSDCFGPMTCPTLRPKLLRQGNYLYRIDDRRIIYSPTPKIMTTLPMKKREGRRRYTPERGRKLKKGKQLTTPCSPCMRTALKPKPPPLRRAANKPPRTTKRATKRTTKRSTQRVVSTIRTTTQFIKTATVGTVVLRRVTLYKNGMLLYKVIKGYEKVTVAATSKKDDSDFLE